MGRGGEHPAADGLIRLSARTQSVFAQTAERHGLPAAQARLLCMLATGPRRMSELAGLLGIEKAALTGLADRAERRGLVARVPSTTDRRAVLVSLTDEGRALVSQAAAAFEADVSALLSRLPPRERETLARIVSRLLVTHAADHGIDLFATATAEPPPVVYQDRPRTL